MNNSIITNIEVINKRIKEICRKDGRNRDEVKLLLATKTVPVGLIKKALVYEKNLIGENRIQELSQNFRY